MEASTSAGGSASRARPAACCEACGESVVEMAVPTVLVASMVGTLLVGVVFLLLGRFRLTVIVGFIPANVIAGFLSCIGWKVT